MSKTAAWSILMVALSIATLAIAPEPGSDRMNSANLNATSAFGMWSAGRPEL
jgi:hypothetical protein